MRGPHLPFALAALALVGLFVQNVLLAGRVAELEAAAGATAPDTPAPHPPDAGSARLARLEARLDAVEADLRERAATAAPTAALDADPAATRSADLEAAVEAVLERRRRDEERREARARAVGFAGTLGRDGLDDEARAAALEALTDYFEDRQRILRARGDAGGDPLRLLEGLRDRLDGRLRVALGEVRGAAWMDALGRRPRDPDRLRNQDGTGPVERD